MLLVGGERFHRPKTTSSPASRRSVFARGSLPTRSVSCVLSRAITCDTFATDSLGRRVIIAVRSTLPGASAHCKLLVSGTQTTVAIRLRFKASPWTTTTGRRKPGLEPVGCGSSAHHTSPCEITTRRSQGSVDRRPVRSHRPARPGGRPYQSLPLFHRENGVRRTPAGPH